MEIFRRVQHIDLIYLSGSKVTSVRLEFLVAYDIEDSKKRTVIYKTLEEYGLRSIQKSVFWGFLTKAEFHAIIRLVHSELKSSDKFLISRSSIDLDKNNTFGFGYSSSDFKDWSKYGII